MGLDKEFVKRAIFSPDQVANLLTIRRKVYKRVAPLKAEIIKSDEPIKFKDLDYSQFKKAYMRQKWADKYGCAWFRFTGEVPPKAKGKKVVARIKTQGEGLVYRTDGTIVQGLTQIASKGDVFHSTVGKQIVDITNCSEGNEKVELLVDCGFNGKLRFEDLTAHLAKCELSVCDDEVNAYYYDYLQCLILSLKLPKDSERSKELLTALKQSFKIFNKEGASKAREYFSKIQFKPIDYKSTEYTAVGHSHLDLAWLWPLRETKRKIARTFSNQLRNLDKYDDYVFAESQPQMFAWIKELYPDLYARIKDKVAEGRIELQGKMWCEPDLNLTSGESWIRQSIYGNDFFMKEFGVDTRECWLPDTFGFPANFPQIMKKCGMDYFFTVKILSNTVNNFPYKTFKWVGMDGTEVLAHMAPLGDTNSGASPLAIIKSESKNTEKDILDKALLLYGNGDGGGGAGEGHMEFVRRMKKGINGLTPVKMRKSVEFFDEVQEQIDILPVYNGELYYERHQGTYTSQAKTKLYNRRMEELLHYVDLLTSVCYVKGVHFDKVKLDVIWKEALLYQFHDILPGSSIKRVYDESIARYEVLFKELNEIVADIHSKLKSQSENITAINPISLPRQEYFKYDGEWYSCELNGNSTSIVAKADIKNVNLSFTDKTIENSKLKVEFNSDGEIVSLLDKVNNKELVKEYFNRLSVYTDSYMPYNAWDIAIDYASKKHWKFKLIKSTPYIDGVKVVMKNEYTYEDSSIIQNVCLYNDGDMLVFDTAIDWNETNKLLRADFIPSVFANEVKCDVQFGNYNRSTLNDTREHYAQFEVCAHKYVNLDDEDYGLALINDCKYGYKAKEGMLSLALLRSPTWPDKTCDRGIHKFSYAIYPHKERVFDSKLIEKAYAFNNKIKLVSGDLQLPNIATVIGEGVIIETIKPAENLKGVIVRLYETRGENAKVSLNVNDKFKFAYDCDMLENINAEQVLDELNFTPFEIKTILLTEKVMKK